MSHPTFSLFPPNITRDHKYMYRSMYLGPCISDTRTDLTYLRFSPLASRLSPLRPTRTCLLEYCCSVVTCDPLLRISPLLPLLFPPPCPHQPSQWTRCSSRPSNPPTRRRPRTLCPSNRDGSLFLPPWGSITCGRLRLRMIIRVTCSRPEMAASVPVPVTAGACSVCTTLVLLPAQPACHQ